MDRTPEDLAAWSRAAYERLLARLSSENFEGRSKFDALASPWVRAATLGLAPLRLAASFAVSRAPIDLRPALGVPRRFSTKGGAILARACLRAGDTGRAARLLARLAEAARETPHGIGLGYEHPWQTPYFHAPAFEPNAYCSILYAEALLEAGERRTAIRAIDFLRRDLPVLDGAARAYAPRATHGRVVNVNASIAGLLARTGAWEEARPIVDFVRSLQRPDGAWPYSDEQSFVDGYHTGFVLDALAPYVEASGDAAAAEARARGLAFYRARLFDSDGAPRWRDDAAYPRDVQGAAQGILTFLRAGDVETADRILAWTREHLWDEAAGRFDLRETRWRRQKSRLIGWSDDLIAHALAERGRRP